MDALSRLFWNAVYYSKLILNYLNIPAFIYDNVITRPLTKYTYYKLMNRITPRKEKYKNILDVGTGTGRALLAIMNQFSSDTKIVGIDIDKNYIKKAKAKLAKYPNVEVREQNFYLLADTKEKYDIIIFSSSFMLMPYREKALEIAKDLLTSDGRIFFLMTLYDKKKDFIESIKPYLKHYTTIDFGNITYEWEFEDLLNNNGLDIIHKERIFYSWNPLFFVFRIFLVECKVSKK